ncbi:hypothetical protein Tco_0209679 [Tanacetum coccineum]
MTDSQNQCPETERSSRIDSILNPNAAVSVTPSSATIIPQTPIPIIQPQQQTHDSTTTTTIPTTTVPEIPNFASLFGFERRVSSLESDLSELKQTNQFAKALSSILGIVDKYLATKVKDTVDVAVQLKSDKLREEAQAENQDFLNSLDSNVKRIIKEQVKAQTSKIMTKVEKYVTETLEAEVLVRSTNQPQTSYAVASSLSRTKFRERFLMDKIRKITLLTDPMFRRISTEHYSKHTTLTKTFSPHMDQQGRVIKKATQRKSNLQVPFKGTCKSVVELEYHLEEVFKATNDQLDWHNPEGRPRKYIASITKTKADDYGHVKWIEDKIPKSTWSEDYSCYKSQDHGVLWLQTLGRDHSKLTNLNVDERFALNVALRMYTRRIVIQERVEDLQLAVESYQKKLNLTKPDTYWTDLRKMTPYTAYRDIQGIIYQDDMDKNCLMRTDELHKFSDGTLNHVRTSLNDIATGIQNGSIAR